MRANTLWLDSHLRKSWHAQPGKAPLGIALKRSYNWQSARVVYSLWGYGE